MEEEGPEPLTAQEKKAIAAMKKVAKIWPESLWLYSASGTLCVMKKNRDGKKAFYADDISCDHEYVIDSINIENDGGDW